MEDKINVVYDMETSDPDDAFTLCLLAGHPKVELRAVTVTPGSQQQVDVIRYLLGWFDKKQSVPVGARSINYPKSAVSEFHYRWFHRSPEDLATEENKLSGAEVLKQTFDMYPDCVLLTGASLGNPRMLLEQYPDTKIQRWVGQGGFAGDQVVPAEYRLEKFAGRNTCPTFNFNGDIPGAKLLLSSPNIALRQLVSKNVCHGLVYDQAFHEKLAPYSKVENNRSLGIIYFGMTEYLKRHPGGKLFHDPLAACTLINSDICQFKEVEVYREKGEWGSSIKDGTNTFISIKADHQKFFNTLIAHNQEYVI